MTYMYINSFLVSAKRAGTGWWFVRECVQVGRCIMGPSWLVMRGVTELPTMMVMLMRKVDMLLLLL